MSEGGREGGRKGGREGGREERGREEGREEVRDEMEEGKDGGIIITYHVMHLHVCTRNVLTCIYKYVYVKSKVSNLLLPRTNVA